MQNLAIRFTLEKDLRSTLIKISNITKAIPKGQEKHIQDLQLFNN